MAMKFKIDKKTFDALSDEVKGEYTAGEGDNEFILDVTGLPQAEDVGPIKRALAKEKEAVKTLKGEKETLQATIDAAPDVTKLQKTHEAEIGKFKKFTEKTLIDGTAMALASKISTAPSIMAKSIRERLVVDLTGDEPVVKITGADGKVSDLTIDKLGEEFVANADYKPIILASKASGGGAPKPTIKPLGGGAPKDGEPNAEANKPFDFSRATGTDLVAQINAKKATKAESEAQT